MICAAVLQRSIRDGSTFGGQVKFEILVAQGQPHHFWILETLYFPTLYIKSATQPNEKTC
jgi:hypothetical protein